MMNETISEYAFLEEGVQKQCLSQIDLFFAKRALSKEATIYRETQVVLLATLMAVSRAGHLCLIFDQDEVAPSLDAIFPDSQWRIQLLQKLYPVDLPSAFVVRKDNCFYLKRNWLFEERFLRHLRRIALSHTQQPPSLPVDISRLNEKQKEAFQAVLQHNLVVITGGPGTGKSYLAACLARFFSNSGGKVIVSAPTGKAVEQMQMALQGIENLVCGTLHALLQMHIAHRISFLEADLLIVDECSMIDARLFSVLLESIQEGTRVVLIGDGNQLPPVESGSLFADLVDAGSREIPCVELTECLRSDRTEILQFAAAVNRGQVAPEWGKNTHALKRVAFGLKEPNPRQAYDALWQHVKEKFSHPQGFCILSCMRQGPFGVDVLNTILVERFLQQVAVGETIEVPILITRTDYALGLFNGEMGRLILRRTGNGYLKENAYFSKTGFLSSALLPPFEYAYCLSVHKSQGSEFDNVLVLIPKGSEVFGREVLYTAITRAKFEIEIEVEDDVLHQTLQHTSRKTSGIKYFLNKSL